MANHRKAFNRDFVFQTWQGNVLLNPDSNAWWQRLRRAGGVRHHVCMQKDGRSLGDIGNLLQEAEPKILATDYSHAVVGLGLARLCATRPMPWTYWGLAAVLPIVPDLDIFSTATYGSTLGHRGITHTLLFALVVSIATAAVTFRRFQVRWWSLALLFFAIIASHGLLDAMTKGGAGIPFFWPLGGCYGGWGPLVVSDIAIDLPDPRYSLAIRRELLWVWLPTALAISLAWACRRMALFLPSSWNAGKMARERKL